MMKQRTGSIVNVTSVVGIVGNAGQANYAAAKAGVIGLTKSVARELAGRNVRANAVAPGFIETDMTSSLPEPVKESTRAQIAMGRFGKTEDVASAVAYLAGDDAAYVTGQVLAVDGGMTFV
jgi:3-oxoacyl-[acyl-carrier protein] reductase